MPINYYVRILCNIVTRVRKTQEHIHPPRRIRGQKEESMRSRNKRKLIWAYLDGKKLIEVIQAALDNNMMVDDLKKKLVEENPGHEVTFKVK